MEDAIQEGFDLFQKGAVKDSACQPSTLIRSSVILIFDLNDILERLDISQPGK